MLVMEEKWLDYVLVPIGMLVMVTYNTWLLYTIIRTPKLTVIGLNALSRRRWLSSMMSDPLSNGMLIVQTIRNSLMASTLLATASITLSSFIGVFITSNSSSASKLIYGNTTQLVYSIKYLSILLCFLTAFICNVQSIRYYTQVSFLATLPTSKDAAIHYASRSLDRGTLFWSLGLRAFYLSFPFFLWIFGPIPMFSCSCIMSFVLYFLDTTTTTSRKLHSLLFEAQNDDIESPT